MISNSSATSAKNSSSQNQVTRYLIYAHRRDNLGGDRNIHPPSKPIIGMSQEIQQRELCFELKKTTENLKQDIIELDSY